MRDTRLEPRDNSKRKMRRGARLDFQKVEVAPYSTSRRICFLKVVFLLTSTSRRARFFNHRSHRCASSKRSNRPYFRRRLDALSQSQLSLLNISKSTTNETGYAPHSNMSKGWRRRAFCSGGSSKHRAEHPTNSSPRAGAQTS